MVTNDKGVGVAPVKVFQEPAHRSLLLRCPCVGGLTADVEATLVADANRVAVVVHAVGADHPFRSAWLNLSVTTDDVVVADAELKTSLSMPLVYIFRRTEFVGFHC